MLIPEVYQVVNLFKLLSVDSLSFIANLHFDGKGFHPNVDGLLDFELDFTVSQTLVWNDLR